MTDDRLREAISDAEDNLRRTRDFAQVLVDAVGHLKLGSRGRGSGCQQCLTRATGYSLGLP